jgi:NADH:ubiquinone oxidoreductase subunit 5 (subunit L)/multisubunit Na+/H+ antiporter MnhA subunit
MVLLCDKEFYHKWEEGTCLSFLNAHIVMALFFMCVGSVIHSIDDTRDICFIGGLYVYMHYTSSCLIVSNFAVFGRVLFKGLALLYVCQFNCGRG